MGLIKGAAGVVGAGLGLAGGVGKGVWGVGGWARGAMIGGGIGGIYGTVKRGRGETRGESALSGAAWGAGLGLAGGALIGRGVGAVSGKFAKRGAAAAAAAPVATTAAAAGGTASASARATAKAQKFGLMRRIRDSVRHSPAAGYVAQGVASSARRDIGRIRNAFRAPMAIPMSAELNSRVANAGSPISSLPFSTKGPAGVGTPLPSARSFRRQELAEVRRQARIAEFKRTGSPPQGWMAEMNRARAWR